LGAQYSFEGPEFNRSIRIEAWPERLSSDAGALMLREVTERLGLLAWLQRTRSPPPVLPRSAPVFHWPGEGVVASRARPSTGRKPVAASAPVSVTS